MNLRNIIRRSWITYSRIMAGLLLGGLFAAFGHPTSPMIPFWLIGLLALLAAAAVHQVLGTLIPHILVSAFSTRLAKTPHRDIARQTLFQLLFFVVFFIVFNLGGFGAGVFADMYLIPKVPLNGIYVFVTILFSGLSLLAMLVYRFFGLSWVSVTYFFINMVAFLGALLALVISFKAGVVPPFWLNVTTGLAIGMLACAPNLVRLEEARREPRSN